MDTPMITALAAASGSIVGAVVSGFIAWNTQRMQTVRELTQAEAPRAADFVRGVHHGSLAAGR